MKKKQINFPASIMNGVLSPIDNKTTLNCQSALDLLFSKGISYIDSLEDEELIKLYFFIDRYLDKYKEDISRTTYKMSEEVETEATRIKERLDSLGVISRIESSRTKRKAIYEVIQDVCMSGVYISWCDGEFTLPCSITDLSNLLSKKSFEIEAIKASILEEVDLGIVSSYDFIAIGFVLEKIFFDEDFQGQVIDNCMWPKRTGNVVFEDSLPRFEV